MASDGVATVPSEGVEPAEGVASVPSDGVEPAEGVRGVPPEGVRGAPPDVAKENLSVSLTISVVPPKGYVTIANVLSTVWTIWCYSDRTKSPYYRDWCGSIRSSTLEVSPEGPRNTASRGLLSIGCPE